MPRQARLDAPGVLHAVFKWNTAKRDLQVLKKEMLLSSQQ